METGLLEYFTLLFGTAEAAGIFLLVLMLIWLITCRGGFAWSSNPSKEFNWHPLLMTIGMVFLYGNAILIYRALRNVRKKKLKITHAAINAVAFITSVVGLQAAFDSHNNAKPPIPNMYSLHSWLGIASICLFVSQWVAAFIIFLYPGLSPQMRALYYPIHVFFGISSFVAAIATALLGFTEKAIFALPNYNKFPKEGILVNTMGFITIIFGCLVLHLVTQVKYKRIPLPEDQVLLTAHE